MKLLIPQNIYSGLFAMSLPEDLLKQISVGASSMISGEVENGNADIGLIPSCDLIQHKDLYISRTHAISFDGLLSDSYVYFKPNQNKFDELFLRGDVSSNQIILSKILFSEQYHSDINIHLDTNPVDFENKNYIIVGNENFELENFERSISFADEIAEIIDYPYVCYLFASRNSETLKSFISNLKDVEEKIEDHLDDYLKKMKLNEDVNIFIKENFNSLYFEITQNEVDGLRELLKLPYFHGLMEDILDLNFV